MKFYSPAEEPLGPDEDARETTAPYNWLAILVIVVAYIVFAILL